MATKVRSATLADIDKLVELGEMMHVESPRYRRFGFSRAKVSLLVNDLLNAPNAIVLVATREDAVVGMLAGMVTEHFFGFDKYATDFVLYVDPENRGSAAAILLLHEWEKRAKALGARECVPGVSTEVCAEKTQRMYERLGYRLSGYIMVKDIDNV